jgi:hypothetical protein
VIDKTGVRGDGGLIVCTCGKVSKTTRLGGEEEGKEGYAHKTGASMCKQR